MNPVPRPIIALAPNAINSKGLGLMRGVSTFSTDTVTVGPILAGTQNRCQSFPVGGRNIGIVPDLVPAFDL